MQVQLGVGEYRHRGLVYGHVDSTKKIMTNTYVVFAKRVGTKVACSKCRQFICSKWETKVLQACKAGPKLHSSSGQVVLYVPINYVCSTSSQEKNRNNLSASSDCARSAVRKKLGMNMSSGSVFHKGS